ncbi:MAG: hypoxanthine phosphoribosyltransferase [Bacilli bacterium]|nr:hypoxanthine phosphoribosyltransferase [Bacilli bacterium]
MKELVMSSDEIAEICTHMGHQITAALKDEEKAPIFLCVMKGGMNFTVDLIKHVHCPIITDFIQISSYEGTKSTGQIKLLKDLTYDPEGRVIVICEDVVDTGLSMKYLIEYLKETYHPKDVLLACLFDKRAERRCDVKIDYAGKVLNDNAFLVGYGLDYNELHRNDAFVFVPTKEEIAEWDALLAKNPVKKIER